MAALESARSGNRKGSRGAFVRGISENGRYVAMVDGDLTARLRAEHATLGGVQLDCDIFAQQAPATLNAAA